MNDEAVRDVQRFTWMLSQFYAEDNAWFASFCFHVDIGGIRAAIDREIEKQNRKLEQKL